MSSDGASIEITRSGFRHLPELTLSTPSLAAACLYAPTAQSGRCQGCVSGLCSWTRRSSGADAIAPHIRAPLHSGLTYRHLLLQMPDSQSCAARRPQEQLWPRPPQQLAGFCLLHHEWSCHRSPPRGISKASSASHELRCRGRSDGPSSMRGRWRVRWRAHSPGWTFS